MQKRTRFSLVMILSFVLVAGIGLYFYLPTVLGDTIYPLKYEQFIQKYSKEYGVDPALVAAVIMQESRFSADANSPAGAQGLMQFMPGTAATMAKETGRWPNYNIYDAETSVQFGAAHIRDLLIKYDGNVDAALAGYNAGTGNADRWIRLGLLGSIPFSETRGYVSNVKKYREIYATMYPVQLGITGSSSQIVEKIEVKPKSEKTYALFWSMFFKSVIKY